MDSAVRELEDLETIIKESIFNCLLLKLHSFCQSSIKLCLISVHKIITLNKKMV